MQFRLNFSPEPEHCLLNLSDRMTNLENHKHFDCHMHTILCGHAFGSPQDYVEDAARQGISLITFTCHIPMREERFSQEGIRMHKRDLPLYREMITEARAHGEDLGVEVLYGIEAEVFPDPSSMEDMDEILHRESFDFVLGSLHHQLPAFRQWLAEKDYRKDSEKVAAYFDCLARGAASGRYHSLSHPDVIRIYGTLEEPFDPADHEPAIQDFLDRVADSGTCLEINTSGLSKGDFVVHPDPLILQWALERDIPFTIGSDSHAPQMVGQHFDAVLKEARKLGLDRLHYFREGQRVAVSLD